MSVGRRSTQSSSGITVAFVYVSVAAMKMVIEATTKVRMRIVDGVVQFRPTDRVTTNPLPEGEELRFVSRQGNSGRFSLSKKSMEHLKPGKVAFVSDKYGWYSLVDDENVIAGSRSVGRIILK